MPNSISCWTNEPGSRTFPDWVNAAMAGARQPNGTFLINTKRGQARVHVGHMVFRRAGEIFCCHPGESRQLVAQLVEAARGVSHLNEATRAAGPLMKRAEADIADRTDDTDDITRRIREAAPQPPIVQTTSFVPTRQIAPAPTAKRAPNPAKCRYPAPLAMPPSIDLAAVSDVDLIAECRRRGIEVAK